MQYKPPPDAAEFAVEHYDRGEFPAEDLQKNLDKESGQGWRTVGGAPALVDFETGSILAGCPGLEGEDLDDLGEGEDPEHRAERRRRQEQAEREGWESQETKDARELWKRAKDLDPDALSIIRIGDEFYAFGEDAKILQQSLQMGDGQTASFDEEHLGTHVEDLANDGRLIKVYERTEEGGLREATAEEAEPDPWDAPEESEPKPYKPPRARMTRGIRKAAAEYLGPGYSKQAVEHFAEIANDIAIARHEADQYKNEAIRELAGHFISREPGAMSRLMQEVDRAEEPTEITAFDEMRAMAMNDNDNPAAMKVRPYVSTEDDLFQLMKSGLAKGPKVTQDDMHAAYPLYLSSLKANQEAELQPAGDPEAFSRRAAALLSEKYGRQRLAPGVYETEAMGKRIAMLMRRGARGYIWVAKPIVDTPQGPMLGKTFMGRRTLERLEFDLKRLENLQQPEK